MIQSIKTKLWNLLKEKEISLAMLLDREGKILWHRGRKIYGETVFTGKGFSRSQIIKTLESQTEVQQSDIIIGMDGDEMPMSAQALYIKSLMILPLGAGIFLYLDSGVKDPFSPSDIEICRTLSQLLSETFAHLQSPQCQKDSLVGSSPAMDDIRSLALRYAVEEDPVLLTGETGVGKSHLAQWIHRASGRKGRFVVVNTPSIPEPLLESELFGHKRGAFTGAHESRTGYVQEAEDGTLFLDEIAETPISFQARLLQLIETGQYRILGNSAQQVANVRIIAATNRILQKEIQEERFRMDLFYRLNVLPLDISPLRERKEDINALVQQHLELLRGKARADGFGNALLQHSWPGNIRELLHVLKRAGVVCDNPVTAIALQKIINQGVVKTEPEVNSLFAEINEQLQQGVSFWDCAWKQFKEREFSKKDLRCLLIDYYIRGKCNLKETTRLLNIHEKEYPRFITALHKYNIHPAKEC